MPADDMKTSDPQVYKALPGRDTFGGMTIETLSGIASNPPTVTNIDPMGPALRGTMTHVKLLPGQRVVHKNYPDIVGTVVGEIKGTAEERYEIKFANKKLLRAKRSNLQIVR